VSMPFYVAPEQVMKDRADYARKNIARGRPLAAVRFAGGILICAENSSNNLHKVSEIYDRIAFAGVGRYNEFDSLRVAGVRAADLKGYSYSREDVDARGLANQYGQILNNIFTHELKPMEVEILVAEVGAEGAPDALYHILYDGSVLDEQGFSVLGGEAEMPTGSRRSTRPTPTSPARCGRASPRWPVPSERSPPTSSRSPSSTASPSVEPSAGSRAPSSKGWSRQHRLPDRRRHHAAAAGPR
jgi:proteasome alpha subunit